MCVIIIIVELCIFFVWESFFNKLVVVLELSVLVGLFVKISVGFVIIVW